MKTFPFPRLVVSLVLLLCLWIFPAFGQGTLTPPGAPAPGMKTLTQIEPRTPISSSTTPGNGAAQFIITQPGTYYVTTNLAGEASKRCIQIEASNVMLDLKGFSLNGLTNSSDGVYFPFTDTSNVVIRNGTIRGWGSAVYHNGQDLLLENLVLTGNVIGAQLANYAEIRNCTVVGNSFKGISSFGNCCKVEGNICARNNTDNNSGGAEIYLLGNRNRVEANQVSCVSTSGYGIYIGGASNVVIRNFASGRGANNYSLGAANIFGPLISATGTITNLNPWANFSY